MSSKHANAAFLLSTGVFDSIQTFSEFEQRVSSLLSTNTKVQGDAFEIFVEAYLATQPAMQSEESWLVGDIPVEIREALNLPSDSKGIDGVYRSLVGNYVPYQVKFRSNRPALGFNEVASFLGITEKATDRLLITNCDSIAIDVKNRTGLRSLRGVDFDTLTEEDFELISSWLKSRPAKRPPLTPLPHQAQALDDISRHLSEYDRGTVVMACGTGKTLVALWAAERLGAKNILVLVPSLTLMQQTLEEWSRHNSWGKDFTYLCVCSDPQVDLKNDEVEIETSDLPFRVDTDPALVTEFLAQANSKVKVVFSTYQSSQVVAQATRGNYSFDIGIFDEAHKTTGPSAGRFATALKEENILIRKRLFFTATPKHYDLKHRNKEGDFKVVSMDDEAVYGKRIHTLTFGEAASAGIICPYKVVVTLIDKCQVNDFALKNGITLVEGDAINAKWVANQIAISNAIEHTSASKVITFHSRVKTAREFASDESHGVKQFLKDFSVFHVHGKQRSNDRKDLITKFRNAERSLITNARCLTEGIDVPAVDMVAFIDPRQSKIDIAQAIGRAMRKPRNSPKIQGYVVIPVYAENSDTASLEEAIKGEGFDNIALILGALLEQDETLVDIIRELKQDRGEGKPFNPQRLKERLELIGPYLQLDMLANSINITVVDRLGSSWDEWFGLLLTYIKQKDNSKVPHLYKTPSGKHLGQWVFEQRQNYKSHKLIQSRVERLETISDWSWTPQEDRWPGIFDSLRELVARESLAEVMRRNEITSEGTNLSNWIKHQRRFFNKGLLSADRIALLESVPGWTWRAIEYQPQDWGEWLRLNGLVRDGDAYRQLTSSLRRRLETYIKTKSSSYRAGQLKNEEINQLESVVGWEWSESKRGDWSQRFEEYRQFVIETDTVVVSEKYKTLSGFRLGQWIKNQRLEYKKGQLSQEQVKSFESLHGWDWNPFETTWRIHFESLAKFASSNPTIGAKVSFNCVSPDGVKIGRWINKQRVLYKRGTLSHERISALSALPGWTWDASSMSASSLSKRGIKPK